MKVVIFLLIWQIFFETFKCSSLQLENSEVLQANNLSNSDVYIYIPKYPYQVNENSLDIYNENAILLDRLDIKDIKEKIGIPWDLAYFMFIKHVKDNIYVLPIIQYGKDIEDDIVSIYYIFIDDYFNIKKELPDLHMSSKIKSSVFEFLGYVERSDVIITEDFKYAILCIKQYYTIDDVKSYFQDSLYDTAIIKAQGLCAMDLRTNKEISALSADGIFVEFDKWWEYVSNFEIDMLVSTFYQSRGVSNIHEIELTHMNAMNLIDGSHFSPEYENEKLLLLNSNRQDTIYLLKWNFENKSDEESHEIIWVLPSISSPDIIKKEWFNKWEYVNDPFYGFSFSHDVNVFNLPKGHILVHDNGRYHRASNVPELSCPMSRSIEYKIEMDINGYKGFHQVKLMFSYPKVSDYPEFIYLENEPETNLEKCGDFWKIYNYQPLYGSCRKTINGDYVITHYPININTRNLLPSQSAKMVKVNSDGDVVINAWNPENTTILSFRIIPINRKEFRNGLYSMDVDEI